MYNPLTSTKQLYRLDVMKNASGIKTYRLSFNMLRLLHVFVLLSRIVFLLSSVYKFFPCNVILYPCSKHITRDKDDVAVQKCLRCEEGNGRWCNYSIIKDWNKNTSHISQIFRQICANEVTQFNNASDVQILPLVFQFCFDKTSNSSNLKLTQYVS